MSKNFDCRAVFFFFLFLFISFLFLSWFFTDPFTDFCAIRSMRCAFNWTLRIFIFIWMIRMIPVNVHLKWQQNEKETKQILVGIGWVDALRMFELWTQALTGNKSIDYIRQFIDCFFCFHIVFIALFVSILKQIWIEMKMIVDEQKKGQRDGDHSIGW